TVERDHRGRRARAAVQLPRLPDPPHRRDAACRGTHRALGGAAHGGGCARRPPHRAGARKCWARAERPPGPSPAVFTARRRRREAVMTARSRGGYAAIVAAAIAVTALAGGGAPRPARAHAAAAAARAALLL